MSELQSQVSNVDTRVGALEEQTLHQRVQSLESEAAQTRSSLHTVNATLSSELEQRTRATEQYAFQTSQNATSLVLGELSAAADSLEGRVRQLSEPRGGEESKGRVCMCARVCMAVSMAVGRAREEHAPLPFNTHTHTNTNTFMNAVACLLPPPSPTHTPQLADESQGFSASLVSVLDGAESLEQRIDTHDTNVSSLDARIADADTDIEDVNARVDAVNDDLADLQGVVLPL